MLVSCRNPGRLHLPCSGIPSLPATHCPSAFTFNVMAATTTRISIIRILLPSTSILATTQVRLWSGLPDFVMFGKSNKCYCLHKQ